MQIDEISFQQFRFTDSADYLRAVQSGAAFGAGIAQKRGAWLTTVGELNRGVLLYQKASSEESGERRQGDELPWLEVQRHPLLPMRPFSPPAQNLALHELRIYHLYPGKVNECLEHLLAILPLRERYSPNVCIWKALAGDRTRVF